MSISLASFACLRTHLNCDCRIIREIEQTLRRGASMPRVEYDKAKIEEHKLEIRQIFDVLLTGSGSMDEPMDVDPPNVATTAESGKNCPRLVNRPCFDC